MLLTQREGGANSVVYRDVPDNMLYLQNGEMKKIER